MSKNQTDINKLWLKRGLFVLLLVAFDLYIIFSPYKGEKTSFYWLLVIGAAVGYIVYRIVDYTMEKKDNDSQLGSNKRFNWLAFIAGCLCFVPFVLLARTPWGNIIGLIAILGVVDAIALFFIFTCK